MFLRKNAGISKSPCEEFTSDAGAQAIIRRGTIVKNSETRVPLLYNDTNKKRFLISYDPARSRDNSVILVMEILMKRPDSIKGVL